MRNYPHKNMRPAQHICWLGFNFVKKTYADPVIRCHRRYVRGIQVTCRRPSSSSPVQPNPFMAQTFSPRSNRDSSSPDKRLSTATSILTASSAQFLAIDYLE